VEANVGTSSPSFCARGGKTGAAIAPFAVSQVPCASLFSPCFFFCSWLWVLASVSATGSKLFFAVFFPCPFHVNIFFAFFLLRSAASAACSSRSGKMWCCLLLLWQAFCLQFHFLALLVGLWSVFCSFQMRFAYWRIQEQGKSCESRFMWAVRERERVWGR
jgi:hypothetical protein